MENLKLDLTTQKGLISSKETLNNLSVTYNARATINSGIGIPAGATFEIGIEEMFKDLTNMITRFFDRFFDLFDGAKKLEKQMELAKETIRLSRELGAKSIDITINIKNGASLKGYVEEINGDLTAKYKNGNKITYNIKFD